MIPMGEGDLLRITGEHGPRVVKLADMSYFDAFIIPGKHGQDPNRKQYALKVLEEAAELVESVKGYISGDVEIEDVKLEIGDVMQATVNVAAVLDLLDLTDVQAEAEARNVSRCRIVR